jgi:hypothetical protein
MVGDDAIAYLSAAALGRPGHVGIIVYIATHCY